MVAKQAYQALFILTLYKPNDDKYKKFNENVKQRSKEAFGYQYSKEEEVGIWKLDALYEILLLSIYLFIFVPMIYDRYLFWLL